MDYRVLSDFCPPNPLDRTCWAIHLDLTLIIIVSAPEANKVCPRNTHSLHSGPQNSRDRLCAVVWDWCNGAKTV